MQSLSVGVVTLYIVIIAGGTVQCKVLLSVVWPCTVLYLLDVQCIASSYCWWCDLTQCYNCWWYSAVQALSVGGVTFYSAIIVSGTVQCKVLVSVV